MQTATLDQVFAAIDRHASEAPGGAIAFDGDGTLWSGDVGEDFFEAVLRDGNIHAVAHAALVVEARASEIDHGGSAVDLARRIHQAYVAGKFSEERVCEIMTWVYAGWSRAQLDAFAARVADGLGIPTRLHREAVSALERARERGFSVYVVSASPRAIVEHAARHLDIDAAFVAASTERCDSRGFVEAAVVRPIPYGPGKVAHLEERLHGRALYAAFGDNSFDVPMLRRAKSAIAIRPKARLLARASDVPGLVCLEQG